MLPTAYLLAFVLTSFAPHPRRRVLRGHRQSQGRRVLRGGAAQFVDRQAGHVPEQMLLLGALFVTIGILSDGAWALVAGSARAWLGRSPRRLELIGGTGGPVMIGIGASLAIGGRST